MLGCEFDRIKDADFIVIRLSHSSFADSMVYTIEIVISGFPYELCRDEVPVEYQHYGEAVQALRGHFGKLKPPTETIFCFGDNHVSRYESVTKSENLELN